MKELDYAPVKDFANLLIYATVLAFVLMLLVIIITKIKTKKSWIEVLNSVKYW